MRAWDSQDGARGHQGASLRREGGHLVTWHHGHRDGGDLPPLPRHPPHARPLHDPPQRAPHPAGQGQVVPTPPPRVASPTPRYRRPPPGGGGDRAPACSNIARCAAADVCGDGVAIWRRSPEFHSFVAACLTKDPHQRPSAEKLLEVRLSLLSLTLCRSCTHARTVWCARLCVPSEPVPIANAPRHALAACGCRSTRS
jgi:serine/threonine protein kinase